MSINAKYAKLLAPGKIGKVTTRNRIYKTGASQMYWQDDETSQNNTTLEFYRAIAKGGVGLLTVESPIVDYPMGGRWHERYRIDDDKYIPGLKQLSDVIHAEGCPTFLQFNHDGPWQNPLFENIPATYDGPPIGASSVNLPVPGDFHRDVIRPLSVAEIEELVKKFVNAAERAQKAGFDGIDINAGSSHIFQNFLSPFWNRRTDEYGGSIENRARLLVNVLKGIKSRCGKDFPVVICINGIEIGQAAGIDNKNCFTFEDSKKAALMVQDAGADALHVRSHWLAYHAAGFLPDHFFYPESPVPDNEFPPEYYYQEKGWGANRTTAAEFKKMLDIPVLVVGKIDADLGEKLLENGTADFIGMHRRLMADPQYPNKIAQNRSEDIAPCTACLTCLDQSLGTARKCRINAFQAGDQPYEVKKAEKKKKVVVVGGGPAGMEAARVAALRGHDVTLYEKESKLGGLLPLASLIKGLEIEDLPAIIRYLEGQITKLGVKVNRGVEFKASMIEELKPDAVIVATGGALAVPEVKGVNKPVVMTTPALHKKVKPFLRLIGPKLLNSLTKIYLPVGKKVVIIGTGLHGCETAEFLVKRNRKVVMVDTDPVPGVGMIDVKFGNLMDWFGRKGVTLINGAKSIEIVDGGVEVVDKDGKKQILKANTVIPTRPSSPSLDLYNAINGKVKEVYAVGDCKEPKMIVDAIATGMKTARAI